MNKHLMIKNHRIMRKNKEKKKKEISLWGIRHNFRYSTVKHSHVFSQHGMQLPHLEIRKRKTNDGIKVLEKRQKKTKENTHTNQTNKATTNKQNKKNRVLLWRHPGIALQMILIHYLILESALERHNDKKKRSFKGHTTV